MYSTAYNLWTFTWFLHFELPFRLKGIDKIYTEGLSKFPSNIYSILYGFNVDYWNLKPILKPMTLYKSVQSVHTIRINSQCPIFCTIINVCKKAPGKKFLEKKPGNKNFGKKSEFSQVLGKNVTGNKVLCFEFLGLFFLK